MKLFRKKEQEGGGQVPSIIAKEMLLTGNVTFKGQLRLDGRVQGNIKGEYLVLGETGRVVGDVDAANLVCQGHVEGNVSARKLHVMKGATITGQVETSDLLVESGAMLNGQIKSRAQDLRLVPGSVIPESERTEKGGAALKEEKRATT